MSINRDHSQHRKGLVLGLTVAESMLLILFALLLALGSALARKDSNIARLTARLVAKTNLLEESQVRAEVLEAAVDKKPSDKFIKELVRARQQQRDLDARQKKLREREREIAKNEVLARALTSSDDPQRLKDLAALGARVEEEIRQSSPEAAKRDPFDLIPSAVAVADAVQTAGMGDKEAKEALRNAEQVIRENATLKGRVVRMREALASVGKGGDYPPCWVTEAGEIQYLFNVGLESDGLLTIEDGAPASRLVDLKALSVPPQLYGRVGRAQFLSLTNGLYQYEKANECRFYVRAIDRTGPAQKKLFKDSMLTVEARFYKVLR